MLACNIIDRLGEKKSGICVLEVSCEAKICKEHCRDWIHFRDFVFDEHHLPHLGGCLLGNSLCRPHSPGHRRLTLESSGAAPPLQEIAPRVVDCPSLVAKTELSSPAWGRQGRQAGRQVCSSREHQVLRTARCHCHQCGGEPSVHNRTWTWWIIKYNRWPEIHPSKR